MDALTVMTALSNPTRADILALVSRRPMSLSQLAAATNMNVSSVFAAVSKLQTAGLVTKRRLGRKCLVRSRYSKIDLLFLDLD
jgi:DNA-binding transcriptional ArsR family regulator